MEAHALTRTRATLGAVGDGAGGAAVKLTRAPEAQDGGWALDGIVLYGTALCCTWNRYGPREGRSVIGTGVAAGKSTRATESQALRPGPLVVIKRTTTHSIVLKSYATARARGGL